ncbi:hypothetical protein IP92_04673 [Pseudoduganella flava]|uniref:Tetratricopeptide repeat protein n=1 Tax=Pseudoduganella flava TaxID=871742 RepID=A0A562PI88_9BURK|nr:hypothetical protein [Pseudoduganella flava]QGZ42750.1 hypothetical protein GO485_29410 [Pseudoduganella flava]TWI44154.1 hypothetical protein IP92_04673 [Pseudoduganella flava]
MRRRVPAAVVVPLLAALAAQLALHRAAPPLLAAHAPLPPAPPPLLLRLASLGDAPVAARLALLYLHAYDTGLPLRELDYGRIVQWLDAALALDPHSRQPLLAATLVYGAVPDAARVRTMIGFVERAFAADPAERWPAMAQAALLARHRLHDMALARRCAQAIRVRAPNAPAWARELEIFILQDMNELDSARAVTGALLESGTVTDPAEVRFLERRLKELEQAGAAR